ncbi:aminopeptidase N [Desulfatiferula olefinivorans]
MKKNLVKYLKHYQPPSYLVDRIHLDVDLYDDHALIGSLMDIRRNPDHGDTGGDLNLDGRDLELIAISLDGQSLGADDYTLRDEVLTLTAPPPCFTLAITTRIRPRNNTALEGLYMAGNTFITQCEAEGFRRITFFPDRPDVMSRFSCTITADRNTYPVLLSNGNCVGTDILDGNRHRVMWEDPFPKPCYLFALVAGDLACVEDRFTTAEGRTVALKFYVDHGDEDKCGHAVESLKKAMAWDEKVYGVSYDLDVYMVVATHAFNAGAMENKGLNVFNSKYVLARPDTATDSDYQNIEGVIAHEYFHNWTGNRVTLNSWFQLSLKEGLTVFRDQEFSADMGSRAIKRITDVRTLRASQFPEDTGPMAHPIRPEAYIEMNNFYTATVYNKGAEVIRMIHTLTGPSDFRRGMDLYFKRFDGKAVTTEDFVKAMEDASGMDLSQFRLWYSQAGTPEITIEKQFDKTAAQFILTVTQTIPDTPGQSGKKPMLIPMTLCLLDSNGRALPLILDGESKSDARVERTLPLTRARQTFRFTGITDEPVPSLFRGFSAPVTVTSTAGLDDLMFLMARDSDAFNRWDASQSLFTRTIAALIDDRKHGRPMALSPDLVSAVAQTLTDSRADKALIAQILNIPSETELGDRMGFIDVEGIHAAREFLLDTLSKKLHDLFRDCVENNRETGPYAIDSASVARRKLKNTALSYLARSLDDSAARLFDEYRSAANMTDALSALSLIADQDHELKTRAMEDFYNRFRTDTLVLDKWFAVQAASACPNTLDTVIALTTHPAFSRENPNKVRALIGTFAHGNFVHFHAPDGRGYRFVADQVIRQDNINSSIAARIVTAFNKWDRLDQKRQTLMKQELERISTTSGLSKAVYEIVSKALQISSTPERT